MSKKRDKLADAVNAVAQQLKLANQLNAACVAKFYKLTDEENDRLLKGIGL
jgi:hypothetical protein